MDEIGRIAESIADRYRIERKLGAGGMADVYLARDLKHDREIALKVMRPELPQTLGTERFLREIRLLASLQHPNILGLVDSGEAGGSVYYVMPYLAAGSLRDRLNRERELPIADALQILREIAGALEHAHSKGVVHRDIKPENILFNAGHAQVADFGIARFVSEITRDAAMLTTLTTAGVTIVGFSASGDLVLKLASTTPDGARAPDGILALGPNQGLETCFISRVLAKLESNDSAQLLAALRTISETASSLDDWMLLNGYLGRIMNRFRDDLSPLRTLGRDIIEPFERDDPGAFAQMYREAASRIRRVRCIFEDSETCNRLLRNVLTDHMDRRILGEHHRDGSLLIEATPSHFELLQPERVAAHLATMVKELRETAD